MPSHPRGLRLITTAAVKRAGRTAREWRGVAANRVEAESRPLTMRRRFTSKRCDVFLNQKWEDRGAFVLAYAKMLALVVCTSRVPFEIEKRDSTPNMGARDGAMRLQGHEETFPFV